MFVVTSWGLSNEFLDGLASAERLPWSLDRKWLRPAKVIRDPIEEDVGIIELERWIIDSPPLQRLRRTRQLGMTHEVFPGATHTRFSHSIGVIKAAQKLVDAVLQQRHHPHSVPDLFTEWRAEEDDEGEFDLRVAEITILARLGALLHDVTHLPYGHSVEDDLGILEAHDQNVWRFEQLWEALASFLERRHTAEDYENLRANLLERESGLYRSLRPLILSKEVDPESGEPLPPAHERIPDYPFVADIVGNTICADLLDYLVRDHLFAGLPMELGDRFLSAFFVTTSDRARFKKRMALSIVRADRERTDVISELLKHLRYRYEETERMLTHHAKLAADAMVGKALEMWKDHLEAVAGEGSAEQADDQSADDEVQADAAQDEAQNVADAEETADAQTPPQPLRLVETAELGEPRADEDALRQRQRRKTSPASRAIEAEMLRRSDDGLLEYLRDYADDRLREDDLEDAGRLRALRTLVVGLLDRDLYKPIDRVSTQRGSADDLYRDFGDPHDRRELEQRAAAYAGIDPAWKILIWLPPPSMRLKVAEVLVYDGSEVNAFVRSEAYRSKRGTDIYEAHERLWGITLFADRSVTRDQHQAARAYLARTMEVRWDKMREAFGDDATLWPDKLAIRTALDKAGTARPGLEEDLLKERVRVARRPGDADEESHAALVARYVQLAEART